MKTLLATLFLTAAVPAAAEMTLMQQSTCTLISGHATLLMMTQQSDQGKRQMYQLVANLPLTNDEKLPFYFMAELALRYPVFSTEAEKDDIISDFRNEMKSLCLMNFTS